MKNTSRIFLVIFLVILMAIILTAQVYFVYKLNKIYKRADEAIKFTLTNNLACPEQKGALLCAFKDRDLPEPETTDSELTLSKYAANLVGKLEFKHKAPLPVSLEIYYNDTLFGWVLNGKNALYVVYRGTRTLEEWGKDFSYYQNKDFASKVVAEKNAGAKQRAFMPVQDGVSMGAGGSEVMVHQGFLDVYNSFKDAVMKKLNEGESKPVLITGHSLGSAVATLNGVDLTLGGRQNKSIVFASPKVGNTAFADLLNGRVDLLKWTNTSDVIPTMPYSVSPNFKDPGDPYFFTHGGDTNFFTLNNKSLVNNHGIQTYIEAMDEIKA